MKMKTFQKGSGNHVMTYPCKYHEIPPEIMVVEPCDGNPHGVPAPLAFDSDEFCEEQNMLARVAMDVERNRWPDYYFDFCEIDAAIAEPLRMVGLNERAPKGCADAVHMDQPQELWAAITRWAAQKNIPVIDNNRKGIQFLDRFVDPLSLFGHNVREAMRKAFEVKYYYGVARPEEVYDAPNFAQYAEGCPNHPSYVAGHGTVGGVAYKTFNQIYPDASPAQAAVVRTATLQFSHFRDLARVHRREDSREGWILGTR